MYAIVEAGGKQYRVEPKTEIEVEKLSGGVGEEVVLDRVLMVNKDGDVTIGSPCINEAKVVCKLLAHGRGIKLETYTYKAKKRVQRRKGHRQEFSRLMVEEIVTSA
jgi:large subunit ribosomal protein L21